jgi:hypothetical protein
MVPRKLAQPGKKFDKAVRELIQELAQDVDISAETDGKVVARIAADCLKCFPAPLPASLRRDLDVLATKLCIAKSVSSVYQDNWKPQSGTEPLSTTAWRAVATAFLCYADPGLLNDNELSDDRALRYLNAGLRAYDRDSSDYLLSLADWRIKEAATRCPD